MKSESCSLVSAGQSYCCSAISEGSFDEIHGRGVDLRISAQGGNQIKMILDS